MRRFVLLFTFLFFLGCSTIESKAIKQTLDSITSEEIILHSEQEIVREIRRLGFTVEPIDDFSNSSTKSLYVICRTNYFRAVSGNAFIPYKVCVDTDIQSSLGYTYFTKIYGSYAYLEGGYNGYSLNTLLTGEQSTHAGQGVSWYVRVQPVYSYSTSVQYNEFWSLSNNVIVYKTPIRTDHNFNFALPMRN